MGSHKYRRLLLKALKIAAGSGMAIIAAELLGLPMPHRLGSLPF